jgi:hypothetical protein
MMPAIISIRPVSVKGERLSNCDQPFLCVCF